MNDNRVSPVKCAIKMCKVKKDTDYQLGTESSAKLNSLKDLIAVHLTVAEEKQK